MKTTKLLICAISIAAAVTASKAHAQSLSATFVEISPMQIVNGTIDNGGFNYDYPSGVSHFTEFDAFCVDPHQDLSYNETLVYQVQDIGTLNNSNVIARLIGGYLASSRSPLEAAAVQWAIWKITADDSFATPSLFSGNVRINPVSQPVAELAGQYLTNVNNFTPVHLTYLSNDTRQDVVTWTTVPEPATLSLTAFSALFLLRRRRR